MQTIGRYEVNGELGRGGMAVVYRAIDPKIGREVAVKVLPREFMQEADFLSRFQREVRTIGQLTHAAIVPLYDTGEDNGQPYLVMRLMGGGSLLDRVRRGALSLDEVVAIFTRLGGALDEAHRKGVIHRDLKPGNILLDEAGLPYLSDFGIVKLTDATSMTSHGAIGTPAYMSPEHFHGKVNARSDVYAMGIILFQLLTGRLPFQAQTPPEYMKAHFMDVPPLRSVNPNLPAALEPILQRALAKSVSARYGSVGELARALSEAVSQSASRPISPSVGQSVSVQASFPCLWVGAGGVVLVLLLIILGLVSWVVSRSGTVAVVEKVVTAMVGFVLTPTVGQVSTGQAQGVAPTDTPELRTSTPIPTPTPQRIADSATATPQIIADSATPMPQIFADSATPTPQIIADSATPTPQIIADSPTVSRSPQSFADMILIPAGEFIMGSDTGDDEKPVHQVYLNDYYIDKYETTNAQYAACVSAGKCTEPHTKGSTTRKEYYGKAEFANYPVVRVDWSQAKSYCEYMGKQLPTEAHWEKAARGTDGRTYPWGNEAASCNLANYSGCVGDTAAVGSYPNGASPYGVMDMAGNVREWTSTEYKPYPYQADEREDLLGNGYKSLRGGSWNNVTSGLRCAYRFNDFPFNNLDIIGVRCFFVPILK